MIASATPARGSVAWIEAVGAYAKRHGLRPACNRFGLNPNDVRECLYVVEPSQRPARQRPPSDDDELTLRADDVESRRLVRALRRVLRQGGCIEVSGMGRVETFTVKGPVMRESRHGT